MSNACCNDDCGVGVKIICLSQTDGLMVVDVTGITATITIDIPNGGVYWYRLWLSDSNDPDLARETVHKPTSGTTVRWEGLTDSNGDATLVFENSNSARTWYLWSIFVKANVSDAITVGV